MYCPNCGEQIADNTAVCPSCGAAVNSFRETQTSRIPDTQYIQPDPQLSYYGVPVPPPYSGLSIAGFVLSFFAPLIGLILSLVGLGDCSRTWKRGKGLAIAGTVISGMYMFFGIIYIFIVAIALIGSSL